MKLIEELIMEKEEANAERLKERFIYTNIVNGYNREFPGDASIHNVFTQREELRRIASENSKWELISEEPYFMNGIIRKYKPKKCLEIGVAYGGSSIVILLF